MFDFFPPQTTSVSGEAKLTPWSAFIGAENKGAPKGVPKGKGTSNKGKGKGKGFFTLPWTSSQRDTPSMSHQGALQQVSSTPSSSSFNGASNRPDLLQLGIVFNINSDDLFHFIFKDMNVYWNIYHVNDTTTCVYVKIHNAYAMFTSQHVHDPVVTVRPVSSLVGPLYIQTVGEAISAVYDSNFYDNIYSSTFVSELCKNIVKKMGFIDFSDTTDCPGIEGGYERAHDNDCQFSGAWTPCKYTTMSNNNKKNGIAVLTKSGTVYVLPNISDAYELTHDGSMRSAKAYKATDVDDSNVWLYTGCLKDLSKFKDKFLVEPFISALEKSILQNTNSTDHTCGNVIYNSVYGGSKSSSKSNRAASDRRRPVSWKRTGQVTDDGRPVWQHPKTHELRIRKMTINPATGTRKAVYVRF